jgi:hypothetical protein
MVETPGSITATIDALFQAIDHDKSGKLVVIM